VSTRIESSPRAALPTNPQPSEATVQFMLSELERLSERWTRANEMAEARMNQLLTIASGASGVLLLLSQLKIAPTDFLGVALATFAIVWLLGLLAFLRILQRNITVIGYVRAINCLRHFFVDNDPSIERYLAIPITDSEPKYTSVGARRFGARTVTAIISSLAFGLGCGDVITLLAFGLQVSASSVAIGIISSIAHVAIMETYATIRLSNAEKSYKVRFPQRQIEKLDAVSSERPLARGA